MASSRCGSTLSGPGVTLPQNGSGAVCVPQAAPAASRVQGAIDRRGAVGGDVVYLIAMI